MPSGYKKIYQQPILGNILDKNAKLTEIPNTDWYYRSTPNTDWYYRSAVYFGIKTWNILPINVRNSESLEIFKAGIKQYLFI